MLLVSAVISFAIHANKQSAALGGHDIKILIYPAVAFTVVGIGLVLLRRSAGLILCLASVAFAMWLVIGSVAHVPFPWLLVNFFMSILVLIPAAILVKCNAAFVGW